MPTSKRDHSLLLFACLLLAAVLAYLPGLGGGFFFDDIPNIVQHPAFAAGLTLTDSIKQALYNSHASPVGRPLSMLSFAIQAHFQGLQPLDFRSANLALHILNALLAFSVIRSLILFVSSDTRYSNYAASLAAGLWAIHPINSMAVLSVVQRMTLLATFFSLLAIAVYLHARRRPPHNRQTLLYGIVIGTCIVAAFLSKETGINGFLLIVAIETTFLSTQKPLSRLGRLLLGLTLTLCGLALALISVTYLPNLLDGYAWRDFTLDERLMTESRVFWLYVSQFFFPRFSSFAYHYDWLVISKGFLSPPQTAVAVAILLSLPALIWHLRQNQPLIALGITWFIAAHLLESTILPLELAYEHRNYLPSIGLALTAIGLITWLNTWLGQRLPLNKTKLLLVCAITLFLAHAFTISLLRAKEFGDDPRRAIMEAERHPDSPRANLYAATTLFDTAQNAIKDNAVLQTAIEKYFLRSIAASKGEIHGHIGLLRLYYLTNWDFPPNILADLYSRLEQGRYVRSNNYALELLVKLTATNNSVSLNAATVRIFGAALRNPGLRPEDRAIILSHYSDFMVVHGHPVEALNLTLKALHLMPATPPYHLNAAGLYLLTGDAAHARYHLAEAANLDRHKLWQKEIKAYLTKLPAITH